MSTYDADAIVLTFAELLAIQAALDEAAHVLDNPTNYAAALHALATLQQAHEIVELASHNVVTH